MVYLKLSGISALTLQGILTYLRKMKPRYVKKFRKTSHGFYVMEVPCEEREISIAIFPEEELFIPTTFLLEREKSTGFILNLKRKIEKAMIEDICQIDLERIVCFLLKKGGENFKLYIELFGGGNIILTDRTGKIITAQKTLKVKDRSIYPGKIYKLPPTRGMSVKEAKIKDIVKNSKPNTKIISIIMNKLSIDKYLVKEALVRSNMRPNMKLDEISVKEISGILEKIRDLTEIAKKKREGIFILYKNSVASEMLFFKPSISLRIKKFEGVLEACNEFFKEGLIKRLRLKEEFSKKAEIEEKKRRISKLRDRINELEMKMERSKRDANYLSSRHINVQRMIEFVRETIEEGGDPVGEEISNFKIIQIDKKNKRFTFSNGSSKFTLGYIGNVFDELGKIYDLHKKLSRGVGKLQDKIRELKRELSVLREREIKKDVFIEKRKKEWYEKFRWFISSDDILVVGGRDSKTNEFIVRKLAKKNDLIFHADIWGGSFVLVPSEAEKYDQTMREAAIFAASHSNAWRRGFGSIDVYWVKASQLSKEAPAGEYLRKGAFSVHGKRNYVKNVELKLSVGLERINKWLRMMVGPSSAVLKHCSKKIDIVPGARKKLIAAKEVVKRLTFKTYLASGEKEVLINDLMQLLPSGGVDLVVHSSN